MPVGISQFKEQDTVKERARKLNDIARLEDNRLSKLERDPSKVDFEDRLGALEDDIVAIEKSINLIIIGPSPLALLINGTRDMMAPLTLDDGAVGAPGLTFAAENTLGIYRIAAGQMGIAVAGALDFSFTANNFNVLAGSGIVMADDTWIGSSFATSRIEFDTTPGTDEFRFIGANLDMNGNDVIIDPDGDTLIHQGALDDQIDFYVGGATVAGIYNDVTASQILAMDGAFGNPSYSFLTDRTKGMEGSVANQLRWSIGGVTEMYLSTTALTLPSNVFRGPDGAVGLPTYGFVNDVDCGMYYTATQLNFAVGGALIMAIEATNIDIDVPIYGADGAVGGPMYSFDTDATTGLYMIAAGQLGVAITGALDFSFTANSFNVLTASYITMADDTYIGLGAAAGRLVFDATPAPDVIRLVDGVLHLPDGAVGAPSLGFTSDTDCGLYYTATQLNWSIGGVQELYLTATVFSVAGNLRLVSGIIYPDADAVNSIRFTKADAATNVMFLDTTNVRVAIGGGGAPTMPCQITGNTRIYTGGLLMNTLSTAELDADITAWSGAAVPYALLCNGATAYPFVFCAHQNNANGPVIGSFKSRSAGTGGDANRILQVGDVVFSVNGVGADGASYRACGYLRLNVEAGIAAGRCPGGWTFWATNAGGTFAQRMTVSGQNGVYFHQDSYWTSWGASLDYGTTFNGTDAIVDYDLLNAGTTDYRIQENGTNRLVVMTGGNVGIGGTDPTTSEILALTSTTAALLVPRMTTAQRNAIAAIVNGMIIYNTTTTQFEGYQAGAWGAL